MKYKNLFCNKNCEGVGNFSSNIIVREQTKKSYVKKLQYLLYSLTQKECYCDNKN